MSLDKFSKNRFTDAAPSGRLQVCLALAQLLTTRLTDSGDFHGGVRQLVEQLRALGHDLWSIDESDEFEVWGPNYEAPTGPGILVTFSTEDGVAVEWTEQ